MMLEERKVVGGIDVSRETFDLLSAYADLVAKWTPAINLVGKATVSALWERHIADSAQVFALRPPNASDWADLGSGGGFPGLVVAILAKEHAIGLRVTLVESDARKATFLRQATQVLGLTTTVLCERIEKLQPLGADVLSARALAPLSDLLGFAEQHMVPGGTALFPKGARFAQEIAQAHEVWDFDSDTKPSLLEPGAAILVIRNIHRHV